MTLSAAESLLTAYLAAWDNYLAGNGDHQRYHDLYVELVTALTPPMKQYLLFVGETYYPAGGWDDFIDSFDSIEDARKDPRLAERSKHGWHQIVDTKTMKEIDPP